MIEGQNIQQTVEEIECVYFEPYIFFYLFFFYLTGKLLYSKIIQRYLNYIDTNLTFPMKDRTETQRYSPLAALTTEGVQ